MTINFGCPRCRQNIAVPEEFAGKKGKCPSCRATVVVPSGAHATVPSVQSQGPARLSDWLSFKRMITPRLIEVLFVVWVVLSVLGGLIGMGATFIAMFDHANREPWWTFALRAIIMPLATILSVLVGRLIAEWVIVIFRMNETLTDILEELKD